MRLLFLPHLFFMTTLLSTAYFPPISWMALLLQAPAASIDLWETYSKQSYRNRCQISTSLGVLDLNIPVKKPNGNQTKTKDILIDYQQKWQLLHWKSIKTAYQSAPFFIYYQDEIEALIFGNYSHLYLLNEAIIRKFLTINGSNSLINYTSDFITPNSHESDFRFSIHPKKPNLWPTPKYYQTFEDKIGFTENLSVLDLLFNLGPEIPEYLRHFKFHV